MNDYKDFLENDTPFTITDTIKVPDCFDGNERFIIYRLKEEYLSEMNGVDFK